MSDELSAGVDRQVTMMTTLHFTTAGTRAATITEAVGRAGMYLTAVSMTMVALGFISAATEMGDAFYLFAYVFLGSLILLGLLSFNRVVQTGVEDWHLRKRELRILEFYAETAPGVEQWFGLPWGDRRAVEEALGVGGGSRIQVLLTAGSMVAGVNSAVIGVLSGLLVARLNDGGLSVASLVGGGVCMVAFALHVWRQYAMFAAARPKDAGPPSADR